MLTPAIDDFTQIDGAPIAQLTGPVAKLMTAIGHGKGVHAVQQPVTNKDLAKRLRLHILGAEI